MKPQRHRPLRLESLEQRQLLAASIHNAASPLDVNTDGRVTASDALSVINHLQRIDRVGSVVPEGAADARGQMVDVNNDQNVTAVDALLVINHLNREGESPPLAPDDVFGGSKAPDVDTVFTAAFNIAESHAMSTENLLTAADVETLLSRASMATSSRDAIIAVVDRNGRILGVRVEDDVSESLTGVGNEDKLAFAIDGAVAKARTAAFFSSNAAPLTSRTIRFISQSTITQREVESSPTNADPNYRGPGFVAPIGVGGHFPPEVAFAPQVDLFAIEHQSRDSQTHPGLDGIKGSGDDDFDLTSRFNADPTYIPEIAEEFFKTFPESYGEQADTSPNSISRGIATLPGGVPLFKRVLDADGNVVTSPVSRSINLVGGIGVFFPGEDGFATHEQGFVHQSENGGHVQSEKARTNAPRVLEAEFAAFVAASGQNKLVGQSAFVRDLSEFNRDLPAAPNLVLPTGRIDLVGITLEIYGPTPDRSFRRPGVDRLIEVGRSLGRGIDAGINQRVTPDGSSSLAGQPFPQGWLVAPHDSDEPAGLTASDVERVILAGVAEASRTRAAIRLDIDNGFRPGASTRMVLAVADTKGNLLGLYRMPDATIFSIDVAVAKSRNTAYYADASELVAADRVDFNGDDLIGRTATSTNDAGGDTFPLGTALTSRSFRFLSEPRFPTGSELNTAIATGLVSDATLDLCDQQPILCTGVGPQSALRLPGINPITGENIENERPLAFDVYASPDSRSTVMFDAFSVMRNFRDPGNTGVRLAGTEIEQPLANQNGVVFFPGSTPLYAGTRSTLVGGFGVSGDGVDQDDVVTSAGQVGFDPASSIRVDTYTLGGIRVPFQHFNRNPFGN